MAPAWIFPSLLDLLWGYLEKTAPQSPVHSLSEKPLRCSEALRVQCRRYLWSVIVDAAFRPFWPCESMTKHWRAALVTLPQPLPCALVVFSPVPMPGQCLLARTIMQPCRFVKCLWGEDASTCPVSERLHDPAWWKMVKETWQKREQEQGGLRAVMRSPKPQQRSRQWRNSSTATSAKFHIKLIEKIRKVLYL